MGTIDDNSHGPRFYSGDNSALRSGFVISCKGDSPGTPRYETSPLSNSRALMVDVCAEAHQGTVTQWMAWLDTNWTAMHDWLDGLTAAERGKIHGLCADAVDFAQDLKDGGHLT